MPFGLIPNDIRLEDITNVIECQPVFLETANSIIVRKESAYDSERSMPSVILEPSAQSLHSNS